MCVRNCTVPKKEQGNSPNGHRQMDGVDIHNEVSVSHKRNGVLKQAAMRRNLKDIMLR